jgi:LCP family protein required for cell wall assembly
MSRQYPPGENQPHDPNRQPAPGEPRPANSNRSYQQNGNPAPNPPNPLRPERPQVSFRPSANVPPGRPIPRPAPTGSETGPGSQRPGAGAVPRPRTYQPPVEPVKSWVAPVETPATSPRRRPAPRRRMPVKVIIGYAVLILAVVGGLIALYSFTRLYTFLNNVTVQREDTTGQVIQGTSVTGHGRVNIVLLGLDQRPNDNEGTRSDTMLILSVDQDSGTANILSVPRDLWVKIPGQGENRINTAYYFGDLERPGKGGPPLVKQAILDNFGIKVDYFAEINFDGFRSVIDAIGGINLDVKKPLLDNEYPTEDYGIKRIFIPAGLQHMSGQTALEYARSRHADSDLGRNQRQQEVLLAVREQGINLGLLTNNQLQTALQGAVKTDLTPGDMLALGRLAVGMKKEAIKQFSIDANITKNVVIDGQDVLQADPVALQKLIAEFQTAAVPPTPVSVKATAKIFVYNGTFQEGLAARTQKFLQGKGFTVDNVAQAPDAGNYHQSVINVYTGKQEVATELANSLGLKPDAIKLKSSGGSPGIDIELICGDDLQVPG